MAKYPAIPDPSNDPTSLRISVLALKEAFEIITRQRKNVANAAVTWQDLVNLGLIQASQIPPK
jgi:hypothetical protein